MSTTHDVEDGNVACREDVLVPLIVKRSVSDHDKDELQRKDGGESMGMLLLSTFVAVCGSFAFGTVVGYSAPTQSGITEDLGLSISEGVVSLDIGRLLTGYGMGLFSYVLMVVLGVSLIFIMGTIVTWRTLALIGIIPCIVLILGLFIIPESPRWLAKGGRKKEFEAALRKLRGKDADILEEAADIQDYLKSLQHLPKAKVLDLFQRRYLRSLIVGVGLMVFQQFGGANGIGFYVSHVFESAGFPSNVGTIMYACLQVPITALGVILMDRAGRRPLLFISASGLLLGCLLLGTSFFMKAHELSLEWVPIIALIGIITYVGSFSMGMGAVPWVIMSEIFPLNIKGTAGSFVTLVSWFGSWAVTFTFNFLMSWSSYGKSKKRTKQTNCLLGIFMIYAAVNALAILFVAKVIPETKGRSLEEIQTFLNTS
ncbi:hypothetical protein GIB67_034420 [Kingdonia uniflora]|uniref:Major facilitator superfamily (MFS) profile domain-containing protein n=1 Tax=Kingdonia uniflora TaxID=39325 RepID=A0A7J7PBJ5_9MAGN|nr:hypothetical protein GIB67_034420 [Kingdonia uniflora]